MVKLGFIVEGKTEKIILEKSGIFQFIKSISIEIFEKVINAEGKDKLLPQRMPEYMDTLISNGVNRFFILADLDKDECITKTKGRISPEANQIVVISVKEMESWYLADTNAMRSFLKDDTYYCEAPENITDPFEEIKNVRLQKMNRGVDDKVILAKLMVKNNGFSILKAAEHPNCNSAKYFLKKIK